ncbi:response regulator transcription factor [Pseudonocardia eucalypti]|uniref:Response regulator transcription factor n=1 Tax=Pseudonocardia eucalypti TaxID=648755 RepID=A0ABP9PCF4_9PSEU|nr:two-component system response regulator QseB [Pseudonocardia eucalypti]
MPQTHTALPTAIHRYRVLLAVSANGTSRPSGVTGPSGMTGLPRALRAHAFDATVIHDGTRVLDAVQSGRFAAVVLEAGLSGLDTSAVLSGLHRLAPDTPVIALTTREQRDLVLSALRGGCDDFLLTPCGTEELVTRLWLRVRDQQPAERTVARRGDVTVDLALGLVSVDGQLVTLTPTEFALLTILVSHPEQPLSAEALTRMLWRDPPSSNVVEVYIGYLRRKLGPERIRTIRNAGYLLEE